MGKRSIFLWIILVVVASLPNWACKNAKERAADRLFAAYTGDVPGASVLIIHDGVHEFVGSYGLADLEKKTPVTAMTNFRLASVTKQFTAMCILQLMEQGKLSLDMTLKDIFPEFPEYGRSITVWNLLTHTSGLIDYEDLIPDTATVQVLDRDVLQMMMQQDSTYFPPGTQFRYSNTGYAVLAMVVEKVSGQSFPDYLEQHIFKPLHMNNTVAYVKGVNEVPYRAYGYAWEDGRFVFKDQSLTSAVLGDGGIYSSVHDLYFWDQALYTDKLVSKSTLQMAFTPAVLASGDTTNYGFGWRIDHYRGHLRYHHTGSTCGFRNVIQRYPDDRFTVIILTNRAEPNVAPLAEKLTDIFLFGDKNF
ncbi:MAG TPA: class A beta-lactamase-related serine hydrolase [Bacteroidetes bacterium]|nr:class A beta-lactamase-related serine hydrolase [Bacteroidota bacterium]